MNKLKKRKLILHTIIFGTLLACLIIWYILPAQVPVFLSGEFKGFGKKDNMLYLLFALPFAYIPHEKKTNHAGTEESEREAEFARLDNVKKQIKSAILIALALFAFYGCVVYFAFFKAV